jgi:hypothetical protein
LHWVCDVADALDSVHAGGIIHRDKTFLSRTGWQRSFFGLAKLHLQSPAEQRLSDDSLTVPGLHGVRQAAKDRKQERFTALLHHVSITLLRDSFYALKRQASPGVDNVTWQEYETGLEDHRSA